MRNFQALMFIILAILILSPSYSPARHLPASLDLDRWADAIYRAEGGRRASVPYGIFYPGCSWEDEAFCRKICKNTIANTLVKYRSSRCRAGEADLDCLARRYAPIGAENDPNNLNENWKRNVGKILEE